MELAPDIRVNGVARELLCGPKGLNTPTEEHKKRIISEIPLQRTGKPQDIAEAVLFLLNQNYITGQVISIDGGRSL